MTCNCTLPYDQCCGARRGQCCWSGKYYIPESQPTIVISPEMLDQLAKAIKEFKKELKESGIMTNNKDPLPGLNNAGVTE